MRLLLSVEGKRSCLVVLENVISLLADGDELIIYTSFLPMNISAYWEERITDADHINQNHRKTLEHMLKKLCEIASNSGASHVTSAMRAPTTPNETAPELLIKECHERKPDLVVSGRRGDNHGFSGSFSLAVARHLAYPYYIVKTSSEDEMIGSHTSVKQRPPPMTRVMCLVDGSEPADRAFQCCLNLLSVTKPVVPEVFVIHLYKPKKREPERKAKAEALVKVYVEKLTEKVQKVKASGYAHESKNFRESAWAASAQFKVDTVVVGTRGLTSLERLFLGSVSQYAVEHMHCNVLLVR